MIYSEMLFNYELTAEERIHAVFKLLKIGSKSALEVLLQGLQRDPSPIVRHECAYSIGEFDSITGSEGLVRAIKEDKNRFVIHESALAVANTGYEPAREVLNELLSHDNTDLVETAIISLERLDREGIVLEDPYNSLLDLSQKREVRIQSAFKLLKENSEQAIKALINAMKKEPSPIVKHEIIFCLGETASSIAVDALLAELGNDQNDFVVHEILLSLGSLGNMKAYEIIKSFCDSSIFEIAESATIALDRLRT